MCRYVRAYVRHRRAPRDAYYGWALWDARSALEARADAR